jgi:ribosomal protein S30
LPQDKQIDYCIDYSIKEIIENQGIERCLEGSATKAIVIRVSTTSLPNRTKNSSVPRVFELDSYKHLIPRIWIYTATERAIVLAPLSESLLGIIQVA